jgi:hypothetical protein
MESDVSEQKSDFGITGQDNRYKHGRNWHGKAEFCTTTEQKTVTLNFMLPNR